MARRTFQAVVWAALLLLLRATSALQVTPGSPCSSFCIDDPDVDETDPESSNTDAKDIVCKDDEFSSEEEGQKFQRCLTCLQESEFSHGHESDQQWFFYNLRYSVDYCILGYPNATDIESSPCATSESCGALEKALIDGILDPAYSEPYDYCDEDDSVIASEYMDNCVSCIRATGDEFYLSNFLIAIQAGCEQQPGEGVIVGLNDTVFTTSAIQITDPSSTSSKSSSNKPTLSPPIIAGISIGAAVFLLLALGCGYMHYRKRRNRIARQRRASPLSFRCQTHVTPRTATFPDEEVEVKEKPFVDPAAALGSNPVRVDTNMGKAVSVRTDVAPISAPPMVHSPGRFAASPGALTRSPEMDYTTPTSTTSLRSNAPLLATSYKPYVPAEYGIPTQTLPGLAITTSEASPRVEQRGFASPRVEQRGFASPRVEQRAFDNTVPSSFGEQRGLRVDTRNSMWERPGQQASRDLTKEGISPVGVPASSVTFQMEFPPPPPKR